MKQEILSYFNLSRVPFSKEIPVKEFVMLESFKKYADNLSILIETRGIGVITGKSGSGKSCLVRKVKDDLNPGLFKPIYICHSTSSLVEFYFHLSEELGIEASARKAKMFRLIKERIWSLHKSNRIHPVLFIDEAHLLRNEILAELRLLANFEIDSYNALTIVLCGQESLNHRFNLTCLESLANSIIMTIAMENLKTEETISYIENRMKLCGNSSPVFTKAALNAIHQTSSGNFRIINNIALASIIKAYNHKSQMVEAEHVQMVVTR